MVVVQDTDVIKAINEALAPGSKLDADVMHGCRVATMCFLPPLA